MAVEVIITCPLGSKCEEVKDGAIHRCAWYTQMAGRDPQTGENIDTWRCAMSWIPILLVENAMTNRGQTQALESFRNDIVEQTNTTNAILTQAAYRKGIPENGNNLLQQP